MLNKDQGGMMNASREFVEILSRDYWFKAVEMLQQNWALIESGGPEAGCTVHFISDASGVFDQIKFEDIAEAARQLKINGFAKFEEDEEAKKYIAPPAPPFHGSSHPNGPIYSSGKYWKSR